MRPWMLLMAVLAVPALQGCAAAVGAGAAIAADEVAEEEGGDLF